MKFFDCVKKLWIIYFTATASDSEQFHCGQSPQFHLRQSRKFHCPHKRAISLLPLPRHTLYRGFFMSVNAKNINLVAAAAA
ncbi:MAG TPA: hypothetical protein P5058_06870, partial [Eubacteriales bacterium]|nr:hypothetical protein [Eubacteriales bacterium]